jgi:hypothetical protein
MGTLRWLYALLNSKEIKIVGFAITHLFNQFVRMPIPSVRASLKDVWR